MARFFVVSAPSGAGKTTLCRRLLAMRPDVTYSVSTTTRPPRPGEVDGKDYFFVDDQGFDAMVENRLFLEWAGVFGRRYGTTRSFVETTLESGRHVLADVDIEGARQIKANFPEAVLIFIVPPSVDELARRLAARSTETEEQLRIRLGRVKEEIAACGLYDYIVVNDRLEVALEDLAAIIRAESLRPSECAALKAGFHDPQ